MKRIIIVFLALVLVVPMVAQEGIGQNEWFKKKYTINIELDYIHGVDLNVQSTAELGWIGELQDNPIEFYASGINLHIINSYEVNPFLSIGIGTGIQSWTSHGFYPDNDWYIFPLFADIRAKLIKKNISPFFSCGIGYSYIIYEGDPIEWYWFGAMFPSHSFENKSKFFVQPSVGMSITLSKKFIIDLGFSIAPAGYHFPYYGNSGI